MANFSPNESMKMERNRFDETKNNYNFYSHTHFIHMCSSFLSPSLLLSFDRYDMMMEYKINEIDD